MDLRHDSWLFSLLCEGCCPQRFIPFLHQLFHLVLLRSCSEFARSSLQRTSPILVVKALVEISTILLWNHLIISAIEWQGLSSLSALPTSAVLALLLDLRPGPYVPTRCSSTHAASRNGRWNFSERRTSRCDARNEATALCQKSRPPDSFGSRSGDWSLGAPALSNPWESMVLTDYGTWQKGTGMLLVRFYFPFI